MRRPTARGFTLIELLIVIAIISVLIGLMLPAVQKVRDAAGCAKCQSHFKQVGIALHLRHDTFGSFPQGYNRSSPFGIPNDTYNKSWLTLILAFIEQHNLYDQGAAVYQGRIVRIFGCPLDPRIDRVGTYGVLVPGGFTSYLAVDGTWYVNGQPYPRDGVLYGSSATKLTDILDGASNTVMAGERPPDASTGWGWWMYGPFDSALAVQCNLNIPGHSCPLPQKYCRGQLSVQCDALHYWSLHPTGSNWLFADGSVRPIVYAAVGVLPALATRAGGDPVGDY